MRIHAHVQFRSEKIWRTYKAVHSAASTAPYSSLSIAMAKLQRYIAAVFALVHVYTTHSF